MVLDLPAVPVDLNSQVAPSEAAAVPQRPVWLAVCHRCGHLFNAAFDPSAIGYDQAYENTLHYSQQFQTFAGDLADRLVADHDLVGGLVVEVGCGPGHFLTMLCNRGAGRAVGFDPSYDPDRFEAPDHPAVEISSEELVASADLRPNLALSQHVLEHLDDPVGLLRTLAAIVADGGVVYSEVPNGELMLDRTALWDVLYEHVSYFTEVSLRTVLGRAGLPPAAVGVAFGDQFLWAESSVGPVEPELLPPRSAVEPVIERAVAFGQDATARLEQAAVELSQTQKSGPVALWGAGTKGMTYLNLVEGADDVAAVVDINPRKRGFGVPGTSLTIEAPEALSAIEPATVYIANPIYRSEIAAELAALGVTASVVPLWE